MGSGGCLAGDRGAASMGERGASGNAARGTRSHASYRDPAARAYPRSVSRSLGGLTRSRSDSNNGRVPGNSVSRGELPIARRSHAEPRSRGEQPIARRSHAEDAEDAEDAENCNRHGVCHRERQRRICFRYWTGDVQILPSGQDDRPCSRCRSPRPPRSPRETPVRSAGQFSAAPRLRVRRQVPDQSPYDRRRKRKRPLKPNGENWLYGKMPKFALPDAVALPGLSFWSG